MTNQPIYHIDECGQIRAKNLSAYWIPELTVQEKIGGTIYTVSGSYEGGRKVLFASWNASPLKIFLRNWRLADDKRKMLC
jgi:hypothetical protein